MVAVAGAPGQWVAVEQRDLGPSFRSRLWFSEDGVEWAEAEIGRMAGADLSIEDVTEAGPGFVAVGTASGADPTNPSGVILTSADGRAWRHPPLGSEVVGHAYLASISAGEGGPLVVGSRVDGNSLLLGSRDGVDWNRREDTLLMDANITDVEWVKGRLVAVGSEGNIASAWTSTGGQDWVFHEVGTAGRVTHVGRLVQGQYGLLAIGHDAGRCAGSCPGVATAWRSVNGDVWERTPDNAEVLVSEAISPAGGAGFAAVGDGQAWTSADGYSWTLAEAVHAPEGARVTDVSVVGDQLVAVGEVTDLAGNARPWVGHATVVERPLE